MAYIIYSSLGEKMQSGPFPHKAGEFCVNVLRKDVRVWGGEAIILNIAIFSSPLLPLGFRNAKFRIGKPAKNDRFSSHEFVKFGYVGLYLVEDLYLGEDAADVDTDMFMEEVVSGDRLPEKPFDAIKIRKREI